MRPMTTWHRLGDKPELLLQVPTVFKLDRWSVAVFHHDGRFRAIGNACNHKGGPLSEGRLHGEFVMCPWHAWEYSVITGKGPEGYDEEQVPVFAVEEREDGVYVQTPPVMPRRLVKHKPSHLLEVHPKPAGAPPRVLVISTTAMDDVNPRFSTSDALLEHALDQAKRRGADTQHIKLRDLKFRHCEGNYSKAARACTWPCASTARTAGDQLTAVDEGLVRWGAVVLVGTHIRWGNGRADQYGVGPMHQPLEDCRQLILGIALGDGTGPRTGARRLRVVALTMTELEITQFDVLRIGSAALRLVQGVLEQRVGSRERSEEH